MALEEEEKSEWKKRRGEERKRGSGHKAAEVRQRGNVK